MSGRLLYPRLTDRTALELREALLATSFEEAGSTYSLAHPSAYFAAVGGERATEERLRAVRQTVLDELEPWLSRARSGTLHRGNRAEMDGPLGIALHRGMDIIPADAAHDGTWSFLSLVLLPEVVKARFPEGHVNRWLGRPRNALRRTWWRQHVLGDIEVPRGVSPLGEDELVGLFERSTLASDQRLVRLLARRILEHRGVDRSDFARRLSKRVLADLAYTETSLLDDTELSNFVEEALRPRAQFSLPVIEEGSAARSFEQAAEEPEAPYASAPSAAQQADVRSNKPRRLARLFRSKSRRSADVGLTTSADSSNQLSAPPVDRWPEKPVLGPSATDIEMQLSPRRQLYMRFWDSYLTEFQRRYPGWTRKRRPPTDSWVDAPSGISGIFYATVFAGGGRLRVELYVDPSNAALREVAYDRLASRREQIEERFGAPLTWEPLEGRRASRIAFYRDGAIDELEHWDEFCAWAIQHIGRLRDAMQPAVNALRDDMQ